MLYELGYKGEKISLQIDSIEELNDAISHIKPNDSMFLSLDSDNGYIQMAGSENNFTVELRINLLVGFKHYRIGRKKMSKVWTQISSESGPINMLLHEVFSFEEVKKIFQTYVVDFSEANLRGLYNLRNISKEFQ